MERRGRLYHAGPRSASAPHHYRFLRLVGLRRGVATPLAAMALADRVVARPDPTEGGLFHCPGAGHVGSGVARVHHRGGLRQFDGRGCVQWWVLARVGRSATRASGPVVSGAPRPGDLSHPHPPGPTNAVADALSRGYPSPDRLSSWQLQSQLDAIPASWPEPWATPTWNGRARAGAGCGGFCAGGTNGRVPSHLRDGTAPVPTVLRLNRRLTVPD